MSRILKTARGQLDALLKMVEEDRYCVDISNQLLAVEALLRKANREVLTAHLRHCVQQAVEQGDAQGKIEELVRILEKMSR